MGRRITKYLVKNLSDLRRSRRPEMRQTYAHYRRAIEFQRGSVLWPQEAKSGWILTALRRLVRHAGETTEYYRDQFRELGFDPTADFGFDDFAALPVLEREIITENSERLLSKAMNPVDRVKDSTGGSTGRPLEIFQGPEERGWSESTMQFSFEKIGIPVGSRKAFLWGHHLDPQLSDSLSDRLRSFALNERFFDCFRLSSELMSRFHESFEAYSPDCIVAYASALAHFSEFLDDIGIEPKNYPGTCFVTGAEKLFDFQRARIEKVFGPEKPIHERYGGRDFGLIAIQREPQQCLNLEIDWTWALVEPEMTAETSSLLVTKLHADAMPMLRYRVGDEAEFPTDSRPGYPTFELNRVIGRELDRIWRPNGSSVAGEQFPHLLKDFSVHEFMLLQGENFDIQLKLVPKDVFAESQLVEIRRIISANLPGLPLDIQLVDRIERTESNKWRPVMSEVAEFRRKHH